MSERVEVRDGKVFRVVEIPEEKPRKRKKAVMTRAMARELAIGKRQGFRPGIVRCSSCKRTFFRSQIAKRVRKKQVLLCGECARTFAESPALERAFWERLERES